mgnify:FL=1
MPDIAPVQHQQDNGVIECLKDLLRRAEAGEVIAICGVQRLTGEEFAEFYSPGVLEKWTIPFLAYLRVLQMRLEREIPLDRPSRDFNT